MSSRLIRVEPLTADAYAAFGSVIEAEQGPHRPANQGRARVWDRLAQLVNLRDEARANLSVFRCTPDHARPIALRCFERHPFSTQVFVPMQATRYLVVVAPGDSAPRLEEARAFLVSGRQAVSYAPGTWHHPMIALDIDTDFACIVFENGSSGDCEVASIDSALSVDLM